MAITLAQGIMLGVFAIIAGLDSWLEILYIFRPMARMSMVRTKIVRFCRMRMVVT